MNFPEQTHFKTVAIFHAIYEPPPGNEHLAFDPQIEGLGIRRGIDPLSDMDRWCRHLFRELVGPGKEIHEILGDVRIAIRVLMELADGHKTPLEPGQITLSVSHLLHG